MNLPPPIINPPPGGTPPSPLPPNRSKRHGCLTTWLILMLLAEAISLIGEIGMKLIGGTSSLNSLAKLPPEPSWYILGMTLLAGLDIFCVIFIFKWKKWAFYGSALVGVGVMVLTLAAQLSFVAAISGLFMPAILYAVLQIGGENSGWRRLR